MDHLTPYGREMFDRAFSAIRWRRVFQPMEMTMSEKHDVTKSSNPDVVALLDYITVLANSVTKLVAEVEAIRGELASLPQAYVVPGPNGEIPNGTIQVGAGIASLGGAFASSDGAGGGGGGEAKPAGDVVSIKPARVKGGKAIG